MNQVADGSQVAWFVGAAYGTDDQTKEFISEGIWENGYEDKYVDLVKSMCPGERIAIKSSYTRKHDLPFDNRGQSVSVMAIKAIGVISSNPKDGKLVTVKWTRVEPVREWYFYTQRGTVWRVLPGDWMTDGLVAFALGASHRILKDFVTLPSGESAMVPSHQMNKDSSGLAFTKQSLTNWHCFAVIGLRSSRALRKSYRKPRVPDI